MGQVTTIKTYGTFEELTEERQLKEIDKMASVAWKVLN